jgi:hypothetical protein
VRVLWRIGDEGGLVYNAQRVIEGALPSRDFVEIMGPASFYWLGLFFKIFGTNIFVARAVLLLTGSLTTLLLYWMTQRVCKSPFAVLPSIFYLIISIPLWPGTNHHWDSNFFALLAVGAFFLWQDRQRMRFLAISGILAGLTSCFMQQKGLCIILALAIVVWRDGYRTGQTKSRIIFQLGTLMCGYAGVGCLVLLFYYLSGSLHGLVDANLVGPISGYSQLNTVPYGFGLMEFYFSSYLKFFQAILPFPIDRAMLGLILIPLILIYLLPFLLLGVTSVACFQRSSRGMIFSAAMLPYWATGIALWASEMHRKDFLHLIYGAPLLLILLFMIWDCCFRNKPIFQSVGIGIVSVSIVLFACFNLLAPANANQKIESRRGVLYGFKEDSALKFLTENTAPGDYVFVHPYYPMYYFLADIKNPTRYSVSYYCSDGQADEIIGDIKRKSVKYVLWDNVVSGANLKTWFPQYDRPSDGDLRLEQFIKDRYQVIGTGNGFDFLQRRKDQTAN